MDDDSLERLAALPPIDLSADKAKKLRQVAHRILEDSAEADKEPWWQTFELPAAIAFGLPQVAWAIWAVFVR